ncbi:MAG: N-acetyl-gamma-glutamyl-phosphate reductase [Kiritimatiellae bacterium]|nr:N-acetyl-gamma-glutamyl-phosphate reductase [Kiritimatiellia bacterium]
MGKKIFIDGSAGTTGLRIRERLASRTDLGLVVLPDELRKDTAARRDALNAADVAFLCLPDAAAIEAVSLVESPDTVVIDTSTAHRTKDGWEYGFPELAGRRGRIAAAKRIANPGCHASGFIALVEPLVRAGLVARDAKLCAFSLTGYSGGGKKMIAQYEEELRAPSGGSGDPPRPLSANLYLGGRQYALAQAHKHLPEMSKICGLDFAPCFSPIVVPHLSGMEVTVPLHGVDVEAVKDCYREYYGAVGRETVDERRGMVAFVEDPAAGEGGFLSSAGLSGRDDMEVSVYGNAERAVLVSRFDNLGKGASGAAIQNMNLVLGCAEDEGLVRSL